MARIGRPPMSEDQVRRRIDDYCARYGVKDRNEAGFPVFPTGLRETEQHREWITLFKLFTRFRARAGLAAPSKPEAEPSVCAVCLKPLLAGKAHRRCAQVVELVREIGDAGLERIRTAAFGARRKDG